ERWGWENWPPRSLPSLPPACLADPHRDRATAARHARPAHGGTLMPDRPAAATIATRYLRTPEAARLLGLSGRTLEKHRTHGTGPQYRKIGGRVVYAVEDLRAWADRGLRLSTSDPGADTVLPARPRAASS